MSIISYQQLLDNYDVRNLLNDPKTNLLAYKKSGPQIFIISTKTTDGLLSKIIYYVRKFFGRYETVDFDLLKQGNSEKLKKFIKHPSSSSTTASASSTVFSNSRPAQSSFSDNDKEYQKFMMKGFQADYENNQKRSQSQPTKLSTASNSNIRKEFSKNLNLLLSSKDLLDDQSCMMIKRVITKLENEMGNSLTNKEQQQKLLKTITDIKQPEDHPLTVDAARKHNIPIIYFEKVVASIFKFEKITKRQKMVEELLQKI